MKARKAEDTTSDSSPSNDACPAIAYFQNDYF